MNPLNQNDLTNPLWVRLEKYYTDRIESLRAKLEGDLDPVETAKLRGRIAEIRALLSLAKEPVEITFGKM